MKNAEERQLILKHMQNSYVWISPLFGNLHVEHWYKEDEVEHEGTRKNTETCGTWSACNLSQWHCKEKHYSLPKCSFQPNRPEMIPTWSTYVSKLWVASMDAETKESHNDGICPADIQLHRICLALFTLASPQLTWGPCASSLLYYTPLSIVLQRAVSNPSTESTRWLVAVYQTLGPIRAWSKMKARATLMALSPANHPTDWETCSFLHLYIHGQAGLQLQLHKQSIANPNNSYPASSKAEERKQSWSAPRGLLRWPRSGRGWQCWGESGSLGGWRRKLMSAAAPLWRARATAWCTLLMGGGSRYHLRTLGHRCLQSSCGCPRRSSVSWAMGGSHFLVMPRSWSTPCASSGKAPLQR